MLCVLKLKVVFHRNGYLGSIYSTFTIFSKQKHSSTSVYRIRIRRIRKFLGLTDPDPDLLARGTYPDPSIIKQKNGKNLDFYCFVTSLKLQKEISKKTYFLLAS